MKVDDFLKLVGDKVTDMAKYNSNGGQTGIYVFFSKWKEDDIWGYVESYKTKEGVIYMCKTASAEIIENQDIKLYFVDAQSEEMTKIFDTMEIDNEKNN
tara:strand:- start:798 stop:1094 length:297 start_codon:yes stop_codon:yes gene_type:complete